MKLREIISLLGDRCVAFGGDLEYDVIGATPDSRQVQKGMMFCAMKGARLDGHDYINSAIERGASAILLEKQCALPEGMPWIQVREAYPVFGLIAEAFAGKPAANMDVLAVTGTNGKTTTAFILREIWRDAGHKTGMIGTVEYDVCAKDGVAYQADRTTPTPFELQKMFSALRDNKADSVAIEVSSHALEQRRLGTMKCSAAVFTNLTQDHLDYHMTMENYYQAKKLLFTDFLRENAPVVLNCDDEYGKRLRSELRDSHNVCAYSFERDDVPYRFHIMVMTAHETVLQLNYGCDAVILKTPLIGKYNAYNVAGAAVCALASGIHNIERAIAHCTGAPGRLERVPVPNNAFSVFVDYAHTDDALTNVLGTLRALKSKEQRLIVVFGCGGDRDRTKRPKMARAAAAMADIIYVTSDNPRTEQPDAIIQEILTGMPAGANYTAITDRAQAINQAIQSAQPGDIVLLAGKGHEDYQEINGKKYPFDDRLVAAASIASRN